MTSTAAVWLAIALCAFSQFVYGDEQEDWEDILTCSTRYPCRNDRVVCAPSSSIDWNDTDAVRSCHVECIGQNACYNLQISVLLTADSNISDFSITARMHENYDNNTDLFDSQMINSDEDWNHLDSEEEEIKGNTPSSLWSDFSLDSTDVTVTVVDDYTQNISSLSEQLSMNVLCEEQSCNEVNITVVFEHNETTTTATTTSSTASEITSDSKSTQIIDVWLNVSCVGELACNSVNVSSQGSSKWNSSYAGSRLVSQMHTTLLINCEGPSACANSSINATRMNDCVITHYGNTLNQSSNDAIIASSIGNVIVLSKFGRVWLNTSKTEPLSTTLTLFDITQVDWIFYDWYSEGIACPSCAFYVAYNRGVCLQTGGFSLGSIYDSSSDDSSQCVSASETQSQSTFSYHWLTLANRVQCNYESSNYCKSIECLDQSSGDSDTQSENDSASVDRCIVKLDIFADDDGYTGSDRGWNVDCRGANKCEIYCSSPFSCSSLNDYANRYSSSDDGSSQAGNLTVYLPAALATVSMDRFYSEQLSQISENTKNSIEMVSDLHIRLPSKIVSELDRKSNSVSDAELGSDDWLDDVVDWLMDLRSDVYDNIDSFMTIARFSSADVRCYQSYSCMLTVMDIDEIVDGAVSIGCDGRLSCLFSKFNVSLLSEGAPVNVSCSRLACVASMFSVNRSPQSTMNMINTEPLSLVWTEVELSDLGSAKMQCSQPLSCLLLNLTVLSSINEGSVTVDCRGTGSCTKSLIQAKHSRFLKNSNNEQSNNNGSSSLWMGLSLICNASTNDSAVSGDSRSVSNLGPSCADVSVYCPVGYGSDDSDNDGSQMTKQCRVQCNGAPNPYYNGYSDSDIPSCEDVSVYTNDGVSEVDLKCEAMVDQGPYGEQSSVSPSCEDTKIKCGHHYHCECDMKLVQNSLGEHDVICEGRCGTKECSQKDSLSGNDVFVVVGLSVFVLFVLMMAVLKFRQKRQSSIAAENTGPGLIADSYASNPYVRERVNDGFDDPLMA